MSHLESPPPYEGMRDKINPRTNKPYTWIELEMKRMYESITDPDKREENKRIYDRGQRIQNKKKDAGI